MYDNWQYSQMHQRELMRQAEQIRLAREVLGRQKRIFNQMLSRLGGLMVALGEALHRRYAPARPDVITFPIEKPVVNQNMVSWNTGDASCKREPSAKLRRDNGFFNSSQVRRHSPSRKKSNG